MSDQYTTTFDNPKERANESKAERPFARHSRPIGRDSSLYARLDDEQRRRYARIENLQHFLDNAMVVPGTNIRFGWDSVIGLVPGIGDLATAAVSVYLIRESARLGVSRWTLFRMGCNVALDTAIGIVPIVGDLADVAFKANQKNFELLKRQLKRGKVRSRKTPE